MTLSSWLDRQTAAAPPALRWRVREHTAAAKTGEPLPAVLAEAGRTALEAVVAHPGDRSVALDLLAADALITLALLAQAQQAPAELGEFASSLLRGARAGT